MKRRIPCGSYVLILAVAAVLAVGGLTVPAGAQDDVCADATCANLERTVCSEGGFKISLTSFTPANNQDSGTATYVYEVCSPPLGTCVGGNFAGDACSGNSFCQRAQGQNPEVPTATCSRECAVDTFRGLSHFDVTFPQIGGVNSCIGENAQVTGSCAATAGSSVGSFVLGDGSCFEGGTSQGFVAKCDSTNLAEGGCITMTLNIAGETTGLGLGAAVVVDKEAQACTESCIAGPSCEPCNGAPPDGEECLTRTRGFWGTHPHIAAQYDPVTVCGRVIDGATAGTCSTSEALCTSARDYRQNPDYLTLVAQLTAAKLNLNATAALVDGATCAAFEVNGQSIQQIIATCEQSYCDPTSQAISASGCIEALDAFNNSQDTGFDVTPAPFDRPGPAQVTQCQAARGNGQAIGVNLCPPPAP